MRQRLIQFCGAMVALWFFGVPTAQSGVMEVLKKMSEDKLTWQVHIVDQSGSPISAPTIWRIIPDGRPDLDGKLMTRLLRRYAADADFVKDDLHPDLLVNYGDTNGLFSHSDKLNYHKNSDVITVFGVIKRGYIPTVLVDSARKNTTHEITIVLQRDQRAVVDEDMLHFDQLRSAAYVPMQTIGQSALSSLHSTLKEIHLKMRKLANDFEVKKKHEGASSIFYNLAYLPAVDAIKLEDGSERTIGYTNGYSTAQPQRVADRNHAIDLNQDNPNFKLAQFEIRGVTNSKNYLQYSPIERRAHLELLERLIVENGERLRPHVYKSAFLQYKQDGNFIAACVALKRTLEFEPTFQTQFEWMSLFNQLEESANRSGQTGFHCTVPSGLRTSAILSPRQ